MKNIPKYLQRITEEKELKLLTIHLEEDIVLKELWDNEKDAIYDEQ